VKILILRRKILFKVVEVGGSLGRMGPKVKKESGKGVDRGDAFRGKIK